jgi:hypothetical protein
MPAAIAGGTPLDVLPWQMSVASVLLWPLAFVLEPQGLSRSRQRANLWIALALHRHLRRPGGTWAAVSVARALPPVTGSLGMLGTPLLGIAPPHPDRRDDHPALAARNRAGASRALPS